MKLIEDVICLFRSNSYYWESIGTVKIEGQGKKDQIKLKHPVDEYIMNSLIKS